MLPQVFMAVKMKLMMMMMMLWVVTPCGLVGSDQRFGETKLSIFRTSTMETTVALFCVQVLNFVLLLFSVLCL